MSDALLRRILASSKSGEGTLNTLMALETTSLTSDKHSITLLESIAYSTPPRRATRSPDLRRTPKTSPSLTIGANSIVSPSM